MHEHQPTHMHPSHPGHRTERYRKEDRHRRRQQGHIARHGWLDGVAGREGGGQSDKTDTPIFSRSAHGRQQQHNRQQQHSMAATHDSKNDLPHEAGLCMCR
mmetsp:Transcript_26803/g.76907  ORF Transcript_26803/g.76907 Transcript_26803/m.76907 type:complete len:101 (+) Transcript_26803:1873-2175(+)